MSKPTVARRADRRKGGPPTPEPRPPYAPLAPGCTLPLEHVQAHRFDLVDKEGRIRGGFGFTDEGSPALMLVDDLGSRLVPRLQLILSAEGAGLIFADRAGTHRLTFSLKEEEGPGILFQDRDGKARGGMSIKAGQGLQGLTWDQKGQPYVFLKRAMMTAPPDDKHIARLIGSYVRAGDKAGFQRVLDDEFAVADSYEANEMWRCARRDLARQKARGKGRPKRLGAGRGSVKALPPRAGA